MRTDTLPHVVTDMRQLLRSNPGAHASAITGTGWRIGTGYVTGEEGTQYVASPGCLVAVRGRQLRVYEPKEVR